jgi:DNA polymerase/3'-5' exonuclease PolX
VGNRNQEVIDLLEELVRLTVLDEGGPNSFRVRAYENAARELAEHRGDLEELSESQLTKIDGVGKSTAKKIREYFDTGSIAKLETLRGKYPPEFVELTRIPGLGPKSVLFLREQIGVDNIDKLRRAVQEQKIRSLKGFGAKSEEKIIAALERMGEAGKNKRRSIGEVLPLAEELVAHLTELEEVEKATYCGSLRRFRDTVADIDIVAVSSDAPILMDHFVAFPEVGEVIGKGDTKTSLLTKSGLQIDLRVVAAEHYGAAIMYFTGSKAHNIKLRQRSIARGWTLNEYSLSEVEDGTVVAAATEEEIYGALEMVWVPPPMREDHGEVEASAADTLPVVVVERNIRKEFGKLPCRVLPSASLQHLEEEHDGVTVVDFGDSHELETSAFHELLLHCIADSRIHAIAHLSDRVINERDARDVDWQSIAEAAAESHTAIVIDTRLDRLDPSADVLRRVRDSRAFFILGLPGSEGEAAHGVWHSQRGWVAADTIVNTWTKARLKKWLSSKG